MPCDTITTQSINLAKADVSILADALEAERWIITGKTKTTITAYRGNTGLVWRQGQGLELSGYDNAAEIVGVTKAYSKGAVSWASQRAGWQVKQTGANTLAVTRR